MPTMEVDGKQISWEGKKMILQACLDNGVELPHYCYHPGMSIVASCRICLVEIESPDPKDPAKLVRVPKLVPSCQTPATPGMKVYLKSPKAVANQKAVMEFLLINHPLDCPVCDQAGECHLQDYSFKYGRSESRFDENKAKKPKKDIGKHVVLYSDRCIMCTRCVRFTREISGTGELAVFGRGHKEEIDVFQGKPLDNPLSGNVIDICPVGALLDKDFMFTQRVWFLKTTPSISPFGSGGENILIQHNQGRIYRIKPRFNAEINKWWISDDIRYGWQFVHENRLTELCVADAAHAQPLAWEQAEARLEQTLLRSVSERGQGSTLLMLSPFDTTEEMFLAARWIRKVDPQAAIGLNMSRIVGEDQVFKNPTTGQVTYTIRADKSPNRSGAEKMRRHFGGNIVMFNDLAGQIAAGRYATVVLLADAIGHNDDDLASLLSPIANRIVLSSRPSRLTEHATMVLPVCTWAEKSGVYENFEGRVQAFEKAIEPPEHARAAGHVFWNMLGMPGAYCAEQVRRVMADHGLSEYATVNIPVHHEKVELMEFSPL